MTADPLFSGLAEEVRRLAEEWVPKLAAFRDSITADEGEEEQRAPIAALNPKEAP